MCELKVYIRINSQEYVRQFDLTRRDDRKRYHKCQAAKHRDIFDDSKQHKHKMLTAQIQTTKPICAQTHTKYLYSSSNRTKSTILTIENDVVNSFLYTHCWQHKHTMKLKNYIEQRRLPDLNGIQCKQEKFTRMYTIRVDHNKWFK